MPHLVAGSIRTASLIAVTALFTIAVAGPVSQAPRPPRISGKPNFSGIWQALNEAHWDLEAHAARPAAVTQPGAYPNLDFARVPAAPVLALGAAGGVPGSVGVVTGDGRIPYKPEALAIKRANGEHWIDRDPELRCYLPGIPRATYMPYPFQIVQSTNKVHMQYAFSNAGRTIHLESAADPGVDAWMGFSTGRWEGDVLVVDVKSFTDKTWFDRAGNYHSEALHVVERYSPLGRDIIQYEATIADPQVFTRPWTIRMPLYRRVEENAQLMEYRCIDFVEEFLYGGVRKKPLVQRWEGEAFTVDITRKPLSSDQYYRWWGR